MSLPGYDWIHFFLKDVYYKWVTAQKFLFLYVHTMFINLFLEIDIFFRDIQPLFQ